MSNVEEHLVLTHYRYPWGTLPCTKCPAGKAAVCAACWGTGLRQAYVYRGTFLLSAPRVERLDEEEIDGVPVCATLIGTAPLSESITPHDLLIEVDGRRWQVVHINNVILAERWKILARELRSYEPAALFPLTHAAKEVT